MKSLSLAIFTIWMLSVAGYMCAVKSEEVVHKEYLPHSWNAACAKDDNGMIYKCFVGAKWSHNKDRSRNFTLYVQKNYYELPMVFVGFGKYAFDPGSVGKVILTFKGKCRTEWTLSGVGDESNSLRVLFSSTSDFRQFSKCFKAAKSFLIRGNQDNHHTYHFGRTRWPLSGSANAMEHLRDISREYLGTTSHKKVPNFAAPKGLADEDEPDVNDIFDNLLGENPPASTPSDEDWKF